LERVLRFIIRRECDTKRKNSESADPTDQLNYSNIDMFSMNRESRGGAFELAKRTICELWLAVATSDEASAKAASTATLLGRATWSPL
jgi:hypothetical protein